MSPAMWRCSRCRREFRSSNQSHSCKVRRPESFFEGRPRELRALFDRLLARLRRFGRIRVDAVQSSINLAAASHFGGIQVRKDGLRLGFLLGRALQSPRVIKREPLGRGKYAHFVMLRSPADIDRELLAWLREAWAAHV